ncbi:MAG: DUF924 family protein [Pseudomonadota bacterium]|nr:DUF924 domain-containing protein [Alphaproteobacteria bacterium]MEC7702523.1 DUF924 family protein [Pseudomonadota bacterium]
MQDSVQTILDFWFNEIQPRQWDQVNEAFDFELRERFALCFEMAREGLCDEWTSSPDGALAYILLTSIFPKLMYRDTHKAYELCDKAAQAALQAIEKGYDQIYSASKRKFIYLALLESNNCSDIEASVYGLGRIMHDEPVAYQRALRAHGDMKILETVAKN